MSATPPLISMLTPVEYAQIRLECWTQRLQFAESKDVGRIGGCFLTQSKKNIELALCRGAIQALKEIIEIQYA